MSKIAIIMMGLEVNGRLVLGILLLFGLGACGSPEAQPSAVAQAACAPGAAHIGVGDTYLSILCGCQEPAGTVIQPPATLTCTVPSKTVVYFQYLSMGTTHQVVSTGEPSFQPSPPSGPSLPAGFQVHAVEFERPGTYGFKDLRFDSLQGKLVVQ